MLIIVPLSRHWEKQVPIVHEHKHLGLVLSKDLRYQAHVKEMMKKVNKAPSPFYRLAHILPRNILNRIYHTYILPYIDYCNNVYGGHLTIVDGVRLERLQNRIARLVTGAKSRTSSERFRRELGWDSLKIRRTKQDPFL